MTSQDFRESNKILQEICSNITGKQQGRKTFSIISVYQNALQRYSFQSVFIFMVYTYVVKEKREGYTTNGLLWILPVFAVYLIVCFYGKDPQYFI